MEIERLTGSYSRWVSVAPGVAGDAVRLHRTAAAYPDLASERFLASAFWMRRENPAADRPTGRSIEIRFPRLRHDLPNVPRGYVTAR